MNERIEKLKESACPKIDWAARYHVELNNGEKEKWMNEWFEKFAELIIKDCIDNVKVWEKDSRNHISYMLKRQYGVEE